MGTLTPYQSCFAGRQCGASQDLVENQCSLGTALVQASYLNLMLCLPIPTSTGQETLQNGVLCRVPKELTH